MVREALAAADMSVSEDVSVELIDPRTLVQLDADSHILEKDEPHHHRGR
jgi:pyruvate/2-oxoglutarate/acetoin dehydrogenase E1 component